MTASCPKRLLEIRPKELLVARSDMPDLKRKRHAQTQKNQRDRMKAALELLANTLVASGVETTGTKAEVAEAAVQHIRYLQRELNALRLRSSSPSATSSS
ncbi:hypothetical protein BJY04DRAFT_220881 [Aspergillus karnatakaensis]|uniref:uncharacterized protein n=1 Tax=Aspergillus karnatakaensis TaxID=1810916 RepID=UPI003CCD9CC8